MTISIWLIIPWIGLRRSGAMARYVLRLILGMQAAFCEFVIAAEIRV